MMSFERTKRSLAGALLVTSIGGLAACGDKGEKQESFPVNSPGWVGVTQDFAFTREYYGTVPPDPNVMNSETKVLLAGDTCIIDSVGRLVVQGSQVTYLNPQQSATGSLENACPSGAPVALTTEEVEVEALGLGLPGKL